MTAAHLATAMEISSESYFIYLLPWIMIVTYPSTCHFRPDYVIVEVGPMTVADASASKGASSDCLGLIASDGGYMRTRAKC